MNEVILGKEFYSKQSELCNWLYEKIGRCYFSGFPIGFREDYPWEFDCVFGNQIFTFHKKEDCDLFVNYLKETYNYE